MIAALIAGAVLSVLVGFVLGWSWQRIDVLKNVDLLEVLSSLGTMLAAVGSVFAAYTAIRIASENREEAKRAARDEAVSYVISKMYVFKKAQDLFNQGTLQRNQEKLELIFPEHWEQLYEILRSLDAHKLYLAHPGFRKNLIGVLAGLDMLVEKIKKGYVSREEKIQPLISILTWSLENMYNAAFDLHGNKADWMRNFGETRT